MALRLKYFRNILTPCRDFMVCMVLSSRRDIPDSFISVNSQKVKGENLQNGVKV